MVSTSFQETAQILRSLFSFKRKFSILKKKVGEKMLKNYIWDFDGTLFNTYPMMEKALKETFTTFQLPIPSQLKKEMLQTSIAQIIAEKIPEKSQEAFNETYHRLEANYQKDPQPFLETKEVLEKLKAAGKEHFVITHRGKSALKILENHHLLPFFNAIITAEDNFKRKPAPDSLLFLMEKFALKKEESLYIGDRPLDLAFAKNAGITGVLFNPEGLITGNFQNEIHSLKDLLENER